MSIVNLTLQAYDLDFNLLDSYELPRVTKVSGLGFKQKLNLMETETVDFVLSQIIEKKEIACEVNFLEPNTYAQIEAFQIWLASYIDTTKYRNVLKVVQGSVEKYIDVYIKQFDISGIEGRVNSVPLKIQALSPAYSRTSKSILVTIATEEKKYAYAYPYAYGGGAYLDAEITNTYIKDIPLVITIKGKVVNPQVALKDESGEIYRLIKFSDLTLDAGCLLKIDAINQRITFINELGEESDYYNAIDKTNDTFLYAKPGRSTIVPNLDQAETSKPSVDITYIQYMV